MPYPFNSYGSIVDDDTVGYALETQTRPVYSRVARESHCRPRTRPPVVRERREPASAGRTSGSTRAGPPTSSGCGASTRAATRPRRTSTRSWQSLPTTRSGTWLSPTRARSACSTAAVYDRGAATLHALRVKIGDEAFFAAAREWLVRYDDPPAPRRTSRRSTRRSPARTSTRSSTSGCGRPPSPRPGDGTRNVFVKIRLPASQGQRGSRRRRGLAGLGEEPGGPVEQGGGLVLVALGQGNVGRGRE